MEKLFKILTRISASFVFVILVATVIVLYLTARPAIEEFGLNFIIDSRWGVVETIEKNVVAIGDATASAQHNNSTDPIANSNTDSSGIDNPTHANTSLADDVLSSNDDIRAVDDFSINYDDLDIDVDSESADTDDASKRTVYGGAVPIIGTIFSTIIAMLLAIPIAMGIAVFLSEIANDFIASIIGTAIELLAAIPSIIYGMWALFYFGPFIASIFGGHSVSLLVAGLVLGIMVLPFMAALSRDAINTTPHVLKESAYAMGATKFEVIKDIIFPYAKAGIIGSIIISLGRAMGETMAVAFVIGGIFKFAHHTTDPTISVPVVLANNFAESSGMSMNALFYLSLILFMVSVITIFSAKYFFLRKQP